MGLSENTKRALELLGWTPPGALPRTARSIAHRCTLQSRIEANWAPVAGQVSRHRAACTQPGCYWRGGWHLSAGLAVLEGQDHEDGLVPPQTPMVGAPGEDAPTTSGPERVDTETTGPG